MGAIIDLFCGGGGASTGIKLATKRDTTIAVNHDKFAIQMHKANHPRTEHARQDVWKVRPSVFKDDVDLLWLSPDCRHFSKAKGKKKVSARVRTLARSAIPWAKAKRPPIICLENVEEFTTWGPLRDGEPIKARQGELFRKFVRDLEKLGYFVDWRVLNAADYGAPTSRKRLVLVARTDAPPEWPRPNHGPGTGKKHRTAAECIDWTAPTRSIFDRERPLAENTMRRLAEGFVRYIVQKPWLAYDVPPTAEWAREDHGDKCQAWIAKHYGGVVGQQLDMPLGTVTAVDHHALCTTHAREDDERVKRVVAWVERYYSKGGHSASLKMPLPTITTVDRMSLVVAFIRANRVVDVRMRMFTPRELARAMGFDDSYILTGSARSQVARIGNAVCPDMARAVVEANWNARLGAIAA